MNSHLALRSQNPASAISGAVEVALFAVSRCCCSLAGRGSALLRCRCERSCFLAGRRLCAGEPVGEGSSSYAVVEAALVAGFAGCLVGELRVLVGETFEEDEAGFGPLGKVVTHQHWGLYFQRRQPSRAGSEEFERETYAFLERWTAPAGAGRARFDIPGTCMKILL